LADHPIFAPVAPILRVYDAGLELKDTYEALNAAKAAGDEAAIEKAQLEFDQAEKGFRTAFLDGIQWSSGFTPSRGIGGLVKVGGGLGRAGKSLMRKGVNLGKSTMHKARIIKEGLKSSGAMAKRIQRVRGGLKAAKTGSLREKIKIADAHGYSRDETKSLIRRGILFFIAGTQIVTANGFTPIEDIQVGDVVLSRDSETGEQSRQEVLTLYRNQTETLYHVSYDPGDGEARELTTTAEHPFYVAGEGWVTAANLRVDDQVVLTGGGRARITAINVERGPPGETFTVYNFEVANTHTYYVAPEGEEDLAVAVWVHNTCKDDFQKGLKRKTAKNPKTRLPRSEGHWEGTPGNGKWHSYKPEVNEVTGGKPVQFINGRPDFKPYSKGKIKFKPGQLDGSKNDFKLVHDYIARKKGFSSRARAEKYLKDKGLTPHHHDNTTIHLIPTKLHGKVPHIGSASDLRGGY
jgi:hypothetical protein